MHCTTLNLAVLLFTGMIKSHQRFQGNSRDVGAKRAVSALGTGDLAIPLVSLPISGGEHSTYPTRGFLKLRSYYKMTGPDSERLALTQWALTSFIAKALNNVQA